MNHLLTPIRTGLALPIPSRRALARSSAQERLRIQRPARAALVPCVTANAALAPAQPTGASVPIHVGDYGGRPMQELWAALNVLTIILLGCIHLRFSRRMARDQHIDITWVEGSPQARGLHGAAR